MQKLEKMQNILIRSLFFFTPLVFLVNLTRNPFYIQKVLVVLFVTLICLSFLPERKLSFKQIILPEKFLFLFWGITFISWLLAFLVFPDWKIAVASEGYRAFMLVVFNTVFIYFLRKVIHVKLWSVIFFAAFLASAYGILQFFGIEIIWPIRLNPFGNRCVSTFGNPNFLSTFLILLIPLGIYFSFKFPATNKKKYLYLCATTTMLVALFCTLTRSSWLGILLGLLVFGLLVAFIKKIHLKKIIIFSLVGLSFAAIFIFLPPFKHDFKARLSETFTLAPTNQAIHQRVMIWKSSFDIFKDYPIIGVGWGLFEVHYPFYQAKYLKQPLYAPYRTHANNCHNIFLEILTQTGVIGFILFFGFFSFLFFYLIKFLKNPEPKESKKLFVAALAAGIVAVLIDNTLNVSLYFSSSALLFWFVVSSLVSEIAPDQVIKRKNPVIFLLPIFIFISIFHIRGLLAEINHFTGVTLADSVKNVTAMTPLKAKKYLEKSKSLYKYSINNLYKLANLQAKLGMYDQAILNYRQAIAANPGYNETYFNLALLLLKKEQTEQAKQQLEISHRINPLNTQVVLTLFNLALKEKNLEDSLAYLKKALELDPDNYAVMSNLGVVYSMQGDFKKAVKYYQKALDLKSDYAIAEHNYSLAEKEMPGIFMPFEFRLFK